VSGTPPWASDSSGPCTNTWGDIRPVFSEATGRRQARRFKTVIHVVDSTTIELVASCLDWAKHQRRKAAAKCHLPSASGPPELPAALRDHRHRATLRREASPGGMRGYPGG